MQRRRDAEELDGASEMAGLARVSDAYLKACLLNPMLDPLRLQDRGDPHQRLQRRG